MANVTRTGEPVACGRSDARAREGGMPRERASKARVDARVDEAAELMRAGLWRSGSTVRELAGKWGVSVSTAKGWSSTASRLVRAECEDVDAARVSIATRLERIVCEGEPRDAVNAAATLAKLFGLNAADRLEVSASTPLVCTAAWSELRTILLDALRPFPEAHGAVVAALLAHENGRT